MRDEGRWRDPAALLFTKSLYFFERVLEHGADGYAIINKYLKLFGATDKTVIFVK